MSLDRRLETREGRQETTNPGEAYNPPQESWLVRAVRVQCQGWHTGCLYLLTRYELSAADQGRIKRITSGGGQRAPAAQQHWHQWPLEVLRSIL